MGRPRSHAQDREDGAALLIALVIVAVMSAAALSVIDGLRFAVRVASNIDNREQARLYALGAEELAAGTLEATWKSGSGANPALDAWVRRPIMFPIDGGAIEGRVRDGANCFNLNAVVRSDSTGGYIADDPALETFGRLLVVLGFPAGETDLLVGSLVDWIDTDSTPTLGGAEDYYYVALPSPYRTSGQLLADESELRGVAGFTEALYDALEPYICVRPDTEMSALNINTLEAEDAPLLAAYLGLDFELNDALRLIGERPIIGYRNLEDFYASPVLQGGTTLSQEQQALFALNSNIYTLSAVITRFETSLSVTSTLQITDTGDITTLSRRFGSAL